MLIKKLHTIADKFTYPSVSKLTASLTKGSSFWEL